MPDRSENVLLNPSRHRKGMGFVSTQAERDLWQQVRERNIAGLQQLVSHHSAPSSRGNAAFKVNARQADMRTVLHYSVEEGCIELTAAVAQLPGIDLHARDGNGRTPLHLAAMHAHESPDRLQCLFLLAELGGSELGSIADNDGSTALHLAADKGTPQAVSVLVNHGIKVDCADHDGMTPLQISARRGYLDVVETLLKNKATVSHVDFDGATALSYASAQGHVEIVKALLAAGSDPNACDLCSASPLKVAIERGHLQVASALVHGEQAVDLRNCDLHSCEWLASLCSNANAAVTLNASGNKMDDAGAVCVLTAVVVSMPQLVVLDLSDNQISNDALQHLPTEVLAGMGRLSSLSLAHNQIRMLHPNVAALHGLVNLDLSGNGLSDLPLEIARCAVLQRVNLSCNQLATLGAGLCQLTRLVVLDVSSNQLQSLPSGLLTLHNLQMLEASNNLLAALPALPTSLLSLHLDHNRLVEIPPQVGDAGGLEALHVAHNNLQNLPPTLARTALRESRGLNVDGNPLSCIPSNLHHSPDEILGFLEDVSEGLEQVLFIRIMVMGDEGAGKTSLVRCLHDPDLSFKALLRQPRLPDTGGSTLGVEAAKNETMCQALGAKVSMQFWDLAGQACYLVGHSLLMSDRVLPLYVLDASVQMQLSIDKALHWLDTLMLALAPVIQVPESGTESGSASTLRGGSAASTFGNDVTGGAARPCKVEAEGGGEQCPDRSQTPGMLSPLPHRPSLGSEDVPADLEREHTCDPLAFASSRSREDEDPSSPAARTCHGARSPPFRQDEDKGGKRGGAMNGGSWVVSVVIVGTRVEAGSCERDEAVEKLLAVAQAMVERTKRLHGRQLQVRALMGVSHATRECFDVSVKQHKIGGELTFKQVLQRIAEAALGVLYTDRQYPRALVPVAYSKLRVALSKHASRPVLDLAFVSELAQQHAGITAEDKLRRALAMLQCWGVLVYFGDSPMLYTTVLQARWCSSLIYTLFMCAHYASAKQQTLQQALPPHKSSKALSEMETALGSRVDLERLAAADPGGSLLLRGIVTRGAMEAMFGSLAQAAGLGSTDLCVALLEHVRILYRVQEDSFVVPSLFQHSLPPRLRSVVRGRVESKGMGFGQGSAQPRLKWSTCREYRFNILPYKLAAALTVSVCASADLRSGAGSVVTWGEGVWLQAHDGTAVLIDTLQTARTITIKTTEVLPHTTLSPNETKGASTEGIQEGQSSERGATPTIRWVSKMQSEMETLLARFPGVAVEVWIQCPQPGCCEHLPFQRLLGGGSNGWTNMSAVWDEWVGAGHSDVNQHSNQIVGTAMCGHVPDAHSFPVNVWILGSVSRAQSRVHAQNSTSLASVKTASCDAPMDRGGNVGVVLENGSGAAPVWATGGELVTSGKSGEAGSSVFMSECAETVVIGGDRPLSLRPWSHAEGLGAVGRIHGTESEEALQHDGLSVFLKDAAALSHEETEWMHEWKEEGVEMAAGGTMTVESIAGYMSDPLHPGQLAVQDNLVMEALAACCGNERELEAMSDTVAEVLHEVEEWAPVCKAVFGVIGACLVATGRGRANHAERQRFHHRMVSLGQTLLQMRATFAHNPPPQMQGLLRTLTSAQAFIETFDERGWFMRSLKSSADKEAMQSFNHQLTAHCSDMIISLQSTAFRDSQMMLRDVGVALMSEMHDIKRVTTMHQRARAQPARVAYQESESPHGLEEAGARATGPSLAYSENSSSLLAIEKRLQTLSQEQAAQSQLMMQFMQRLPLSDPEVPSLQVPDGDDRACGDVQQPEDEAAAVGTKHSEEASLRLEENKEGLDAHRSPHGAQAVFIRVDDDGCSHDGVYEQANLGALDRPRAILKQRPRSLIRSECPVAVNGCTEHHVAANASPPMSDVLMNSHGISE